MSIQIIFHRKLVNTCLLGCLLGISSVTVYSQEGCIVGNPIVMENTCNEGTTAWQIPVGPIGAAHGVEGYTDKVSVNAGEQIKFHLSSRPAQDVHIDIYRLGYYNGLGGRFIISKDVSSVSVGAFPVPDLTAGHPSEGVGMGLAECNWPSLTNSNWTVPTSATSGIYLAKLTGTDGKQSYISFAVRRDDLDSDLLFQQSVTVYQAYNDYPGLVNSSNASDSANGKSFYGNLGPNIPDDPNIGQPQARKVSFNRPYRGYSAFGIYETAGLGFFNFEYPLIRWLEMKGYYVTYATDVDTHSNPTILASNKHKALLSNGHDEYWSWEMRNNVERARDRPNSGSSRPINIGFFGANIAYWQIRFANSNATGTQPANAPNRTIICYKERFDVPEHGDPYFQVASNAALKYKTTRWWRDQRLTKPSTESFYPATNAVYFQPEDEMIGIMTIKSLGDPFEQNDTNPDHQFTQWFNPIFGAGSNNFELAGSAPAWVKSGIVDEDIMPNMIGYESDDLFENHPYSSLDPTNTDRTMSIIGSSPFTAFERPLAGLLATCYCGSNGPTRCACGPYLMGSAETTFYRKKLPLGNGFEYNGAKVFAASGQQWSHGLDNWGSTTQFGSPSVRPGGATTSASRVTENVMNCLINQTAACD
ncbi:hypothetical protein BH10ACI3_BH10ACI3_03510 [soil metagenome]